MLLVVLIAVTTTIVLTPVIKVLAWRCGAVSWPDQDRNRHSRPTALWGGMAVHAALLLGLLAYCLRVPGAANVLWLLVGLGLSGTMLCLLGCWDDLCGLSAWCKLLGQIVSILPTVLLGCCLERVVCFGYTIELGWLGIPATLGWFLLGTNALNLLDGMDGLASVTGIVVSAAVATIAAGQGCFEVMFLALALAAGLAGFLVFNRPPARIYLGDCGSLLVGFLLFLLVLQVSLKGPMTAGIAAPIVLLFVPLLDTGLAVVRRTLNGRSFAVADRGHIHHRLLDQGYSVWQVLGWIGGFCLTAGVVGWLMIVSGWELWGWVVVGGITVLAVNRRLVGHVEWQLIRQFSARSATWLARLSPLERLNRRQSDNPTAVATPHSSLAEASGGSPDRIPSEREELPFGPAHEAGLNEPKKAA